MRLFPGFLALSTVASTTAAQVPAGATASPATSKSVSARQREEVVRVLAPLVESYGVSGMEGPVRATVERLLPRQIPRKTDSAGNLWVTLGEGDPVVVFIAHLDEVGFRVTAIRDDGSLELEEVGGIFASLWEAKPALVHTERGTVPAIFMPRDSTDAEHPSRSHGKLRADVGSSSREGATALHHSGKHPHHA